MGLAVGCECGYVARGGSSDELVADAQEHARLVHGIEVTREHLLAAARPESQGAGREPPA